MKRILLLMYRKLLADGLIHDLQQTMQYQIMSESRYQNAEIAADTWNPDVTILEIPESRETDCAKLLFLCDRMKQQHSQNRILVLCPEKVPEICEQVIQAFRQERIDDFVFYDTSMQYLMAKLRAL